MIFCLFLLLFLFTIFLIFVADLFVADNRAVQKNVGEGQHLVQKMIDEIILQRGPGKGHTAIVGISVPIIILMRDVLLLHSFDQNRKKLETVLAAERFLLKQREDTFVQALDVLRFNHPELGHERQHMQHEVKDWGLMLARQAFDDELVDVREGDAAKVGVVVVVGVDD